MTDIHSQREKTIIEKCPDCGFTIFIPLKNVKMCIRCGFKKDRKTGQPVEQLRLPIKAASIGTGK